MKVKYLRANISMSKKTEQKFWRCDFETWSSRWFCWATDELGIDPWTSGFENRISYPQHFRSDAHLFQKGDHQTRSAEDVRFNALKLNTEKKTPNLQETV